MLLLRRVATSVVLTAALAALFLSVYLLWNVRHVDFLPVNMAFASDVQARTQTLQDKFETYNKRVVDMETVIVVLLGVTGLYILLLILTADFTNRSVRRQVDRAMNDVKERMTASLGELKEETREAYQAEAKEAAERLGRVEQGARETLQKLGAQAVAPVPAGVVRDLETIHQRIAAIAEIQPSDDQVQEVMHYEGALPALELLHSRQLGPQLAQIYRELARFFRQRDTARSRFYLNRAVAIAPDDFETANELGTLALDQRQSPDYRLARRHFEASLAAQPGQQRAKYGLALIAKAEGDFETALGLLESAIESQNWETRPDPRNAALVHYALSCVLARRGQEAPPAYREQYFTRSTQHLQAAFAYSSRQLEGWLSEDTDEGGDLFSLANTTPYDKVVNDLLRNVSVGAA